MTTNHQKCIVLFSGGLDSRLAVKIMQEKGFEVVAVFFKLPFVREKISNIEKFCKENGVKLEIVDCTKEKLLQEYIDIIKKPCFSRGKGFNPCIDCKIFIFNKTKKIADKKGIELIVTGDVIDERPLSQTKKAINKIEEKSEVKGRIFRPLSAKIFEPVDLEKKGFLNSEDFYEISGRKRDKQIELAKDFGIDYPNPSGGCLLCEPQLKNRFKKIFKKNLDEKKVKLLNLGRHFIVDGFWIILGRDEKENNILEKVMDEEKEKLIIPDYPAPYAVIFGDHSEEIKEKVLELMKAYSKKGSIKERNYWEEYKI